MKWIIESLKSNREELITKYFNMKKQVEVLSDGIKQARLMCLERVYDNLWIKRSELQSEIVDLGVAINDLGNALNHLGESTETFWGK